MFTPLAELTMTSTLRWTNSAANSVMRWLSPAAHRYSILTLRLSVQPNSASRLVKAATQPPCDVSLPGTKNPTTGDLAGGARTASAQAAAAPPVSVMKSLRRIFNPAPDRERKQFSPRVQGKGCPLWVNTG